MRSIRNILVFTVIPLTLAVSAYFGAELLAAPRPLSISEPAAILPEAQAGAEYTHQFQAEGGLPPLVWRVKQSDLPPGITMELSGKLHGIPAQARREPFGFVVEVSDSSQPPQTFSQSFSLTIQAAPLRIVTAKPPAQPGLRIVPPAAGGTALPQMRVAETSVPLPAPESKTENKPAGAADAAAHKVSGRLHPASLDEVLALIHSSEAISSDPKVLGFLSIVAEEQKTAGEQKKATVDLLKHVLGTPELLGAFESLHSKYPRHSRETLQKLVLMLNSYTDNVAVHVEKGNALAATATTNKDGVYEVTLDDNGPGEFYVFSTEADNFLTKRKVVLRGGDQKLNLPIEDRPVSLLTRAVAGYQQAGAASTDFEQNYFFDLFVSQSVPFMQKINPDFGERWRTWGAIRAISAPQSGNFTVGDASNNFVANVAALKANEAARVFDYLGGVEFRLPWFSNSSLLPSFDRDTKQKFSLSLIASGGFVTPTNPAHTVKTFKISEPFRAEYNRQTSDKALDGKDFVAFVQSDRDRFFRQYYAGVRVQTFFFNRHNVPLQRFPAQLDLQYGVNEYVTNGRVRGGVLRLDGYFPLPYENLKFINLFGTAMIRPVRSVIKPPLLLEEVTTPNAVYDPKTVTLPVSQFNRDYYRVGIGIDFVSFMGKLLRNN